MVSIPFWFLIICYICCILVASFIGWLIGTFIGDLLRQYKLKRQLDKEERISLRKELDSMGDCIIDLYGKVMKLEKGKK